MAAPTAVVQAEYLVTAGTGTGFGLETNAASRQLVCIYNNHATGTLWVVQNTSTAPTVTVGIGVGILPGSSEWFWAGSGIRFWGRHDGTATMTTGAAVITVELS